MKRRTSETECEALRKLSKEETIDMMERRQEAAVLRYVRQMPSLGEWILSVNVEVPEFPNMDFKVMGNDEIASVMEEELEQMELRLRWQKERMDRLLLEGKL